MAIPQVHHDTDRHASLYLDRRFAMIDNCEMPLANQLLPMVTSTTARGGGVSAYPTGDARTRVALWIESSISVSTSPGSRYLSHHCTNSFTIITPSSRLSIHHAIIYSPQQMQGITAHSTQNTACVHSNMKRTKLLSSHIIHSL